MQVQIIDKSVDIANRMCEIIINADSSIKIIKQSHYTQWGKCLDGLNTQKIILYGLSLPLEEDMNLLSKIKEKEPNSTLIALSLICDENTKAYCLRSGADYFFDKFNQFDNVGQLIVNLNKESNTK